MTVKKLLTILVSSSLLTSTYALAANSPNWNYVQVSYVSVELDSIVVPSEVSDVEETGYDISLSSMLSDTAYFIAKYQESTVDYSYFDNRLQSVEIEQLSAGLGHRQPMSNNTDFYSALTYEKIDSSEGELSTSKKGYGISSGLRSMLSDSLELGAEYTYLTIENTTDNIIAISALYDFTENIAIGLRYVMADASDAQNVSVRYAF